MQNPMVEISGTDCVFASTPILSRQKMVVLIVDSEVYSGALGLRPKVTPARVCAERQKSGLNPTSTRRSPSATPAVRGSSSKDDEGVGILPVRRTASPIHSLLRCIAQQKAVRAQRERNESCCSCCQIAERFYWCFLLFSAVMTYDSSSSYKG